MMKLKHLLGALLGLLALGLLGGAVWFLRLTAPLEVSQALPVAPTLVPLAPSVTSVSPALSPRIFSIDPARSEVAYHIHETLLSEGNRLNEVVGTTSAVAGEILIDPANPAASQVGDIVVDIKQLKSDDSMRDNALRRQYLESAKYPLAVFSAATISDLPARLREGESFRFKLSGTLTLHDTSQPVSWEVEATIQGDLLRGSASAELDLPSFNVKTPNIGGLVKTGNTARLVIDLVAAAKGAQPD
jgi:polyisoprenoid-binding protein YceI